MPAVGFKSSEAQKLKIGHFVSLSRSHFLRAAEPGFPLK